MPHRFVDSLWAGSGWNSIPSWSCSQAVSKPLWHMPLLCVQWKTPDDGQRNCPKHVEFHSKNKFEKLVHLVGFILRILLEFSFLTALKIRSLFSARYVTLTGTSWSLVQRSPTECGVTECDLETSRMKRPWPTRGCYAKNKQTNKYIKRGTCPCACHHDIQWQYRYSYTHFKPRH